MKRSLVIVISLLIVSLSYGQELNCNVQINSDKIEGSNKQVFNTLQTAVGEYVNNMRWTTLTFTEIERIECSMTIIINAVTDNVYSAELQVQARRPVYGTSYSSPILNLRDTRFSFEYQEFDRLEYQDHVFTTNLTAMLAYYCYLILGLDADSYQRQGGTPFFQVCQDIVTAAQTSSLDNEQMAGWSAIATNTSHHNRHALVNNLLDESYGKLRDFFYEYHRMDLDEMTQNVANARARIAQGLPVVKQTKQGKTSPYLISVFMDTKTEELVDIFQKGTSQERQSVYDLLMDIDPTRQNTYDRMNK